MNRYQSALSGAAGVCAVVALSACGATSPTAATPSVGSAVTHSTLSPVVASPLTSSAVASANPMTADLAGSATTTVNASPSPSGSAPTTGAGTALDSEPSAAQQPPMPVKPSGGATQAPTDESSVAVVGSAPVGSGGFSAMNVASALPRLGANRIYVPKLGINTSIVAAPVKAGALVVPGATKVGRWTGSVGYGAKTGRAVIAGHTLSYGRYKGALAPIARATKGTVIYVSDSAGRVYRFRVTARTEVPKSALPADVFYGRDSMKLELVTCGGVILRGWHHKDNVVVTAVRF